MKLVEPNRCTGCGACVESCPRQAIGLVEDSEGFMMPEINTTDCVECGLCNTVCPVMNFPDSRIPLNSYAAQNRDEQVLEDSTSGGIFTAIAKEIFRRNGVVYGCVFDREYNAVIIKAEKMEDIVPMRGSKYTWSWAGDVFHEIKTRLKNGGTVLFTGLPCQIAGLKNYLRKDYPTLFLAGCFCGGTPSPLVLKEYVKSISTPESIDQLQLKFRDKRQGGVGVHVTYTNKHGKRVHQTLVQNSYYYGFFSKVFNRRSCYKCLFRYRNRVEDITVGDYWGVENYHREFDAAAGVSALLVNTEKGEELINSVRDEIKICETRIEDIAHYNNLTLGDTKREFAYAEFRDAFFMTLKKHGWKKAEIKYLIFNKNRIRMWVRDTAPSRYRRVIKKAIGR